MTNPRNKSISVVICTFFGVGFIPFAPGTWGALAALPLAWLIRSGLGDAIFLALTVLFFFIGAWASNCFIDNVGRDDPGAIVIDEVVGQWMTLLWFPNDITFYIIGFFLFRIFDIFKPWPIILLDKKIKGGFGVMLDDIAAAFFSWVGIYALLETGMI